MKHGMIKTLVMRTITVAQRVLLHLDLEVATNLYYKLAKTHFKMHFGKDLVEEVFNNTEIAYKAAKRHSRLVVRTLYSNSEPTRQRMVRAAARGSFVKNFLLESNV